MKNAASDKTNDLDKLIMDGMGGSSSDKSSDKSKSKAPRSPLVLGIVFIFLVGALTVFLISKYMFGSSKTAVKTPIKDITKVSASEGCTPTETKTLTLTPQGFTPDAGVINLSVNDPSSYCLGLTITNNFGSKQSVFFPSVIVSSNPLNVSLENGTTYTTNIKFDAYATGQTTQTHYMLGGIYAQGFENLKGKIVLTKSAAFSAGYQSLATGHSHACAIKNDGSIVCWGSNDYRQLNPPSGTDYKSISAGGFHTCAIKNDDSIVCWGFNAFGNTAHPSGTDYKSISAGNYHTCAIKNDDSIVCWGYNAQGQSTPPSGTNYKSISTSHEHACAIKNDGSIVCWGISGFGQTTPPSGTDYKSISAGDLHTCAIKNDGSIVCWGSNGYGQSTPPSGTNYKSISAGGYHTCAIKNDGSIVCWGSNGYGQSTPPSGDNFKQISVGNYNACALKDDDSIICWGDISQPPN